VEVGDGCHDGLWKAIFLKPQGLKPLDLANVLRGAEAPLFHVMVTRSAEGPLFPWEIFPCDGQPMATR